MIYIELISRLKEDAISSLILMVKEEDPIQEKVSISLEDTKRKRVAISLANIICILFIWLK